LYPPSDTCKLQGGLINKVSTVVIVAAIAATVAVRVTQAGAPTWKVAHVTAYSTRENLTGCYAPGKCRTACGNLLNDKAFTVAANPRWGLGCGSRILFCNARRCHTSTVTDRTGSYFDFEFSYALAMATGQTSRNWDSPRYVTWKRLYK